MAVTRRLPVPTAGTRGMTMVELLVGSAIMITVLGVSTTVLTRSSTMFRQQRVAMDGRNNGAAAIDMLARLLRQSSCVSATNVYCQAIMPDPDGNGSFDSVRVQADWNPRDGALDDPYEDVLFVVGGGTLFKREPSDAALVPFSDRIQSLTFAYTDQNGGALTNPIARPDLIGGVTITVVTPQADGLPAVTSSTSVSIRRIK